MFLLIRIDTQYALSCKVSLPVRVSRNWSKLSYAIPTANEESGTRSGGEIFEADVKVFVCCFKLLCCCVTNIVPILLSTQINFLKPVMLLTARPSFKCFEDFFLPFVMENTVSAAKDSTLILLANS